MLDTGSNKNKLEHASRGKFEPGPPKGVSGPLLGAFCWDLVLELLSFRDFSCSCITDLLHFRNRNNVWMHRIQESPNHPRSGETLQRRMEEEKQPSERETLADLLSEEQEGFFRFWGRNIVRDTERRERIRKKSLQGNIVNDPARGIYQWIDPENYWQVQGSWLRSDGRLKTSEITPENTLAMVLRAYAG